MGGLYHSVLRTHICVCTLVRYHTHKKNGQRALDGSRIVWYTFAIMTKKPTMTELLREAVAEAPTLLGLQNATGLNRAALRAFRDGRQSLRLDLAEKLAAYFGIECRRPRRRPGKKER